MAKPRGRDQGAALQRLMQILSLPAAGGSQGVRRDTLETQVELGAALPEDRLDVLRRELRYLREIGWQIRVEGGGAATRWILEDKDPRLHTMLDRPELAQLTRAAHKGGRDPQTLGLLVHVGGTLPFPVEIRTTDIFFLEEFLHALNHRCLVHFTYDDKPRTLHVDEVRQTAAGVWLIIGREVGSDDQKQFRIDRIGRIERTNSFERSNDLAVAEPGSASARQLDHTASDALQIPDASPTIAACRSALTCAPPVTSGMISSTMSSEYRSFEVTRIASAASRFFAASRQRIAAQPSGLITE